MIRRSAGGTQAGVDGFSLVEVVVAIGVFVTGVVGALALLSSTTRQTGQTRDVLTAARVGESTLVWLRDRPAAEIAAAVETAAEGAYWVDHDGRRFSWHESLDVRDAYFLVVVEQAEALAETDAEGRALGTRHLLRVSWPMWQAPGQRADPMNMESFTFNFFVGQ